MLELPISQRENGTARPASRQKLAPEEAENEKIRTEIRTRPVEKMRAICVYPPVLNLNFEQNFNF